MNRLTHEQFDAKVTGLAATYEALGQIDFTPAGLTNGEVENSVLYGSPEYFPFGTDFARGVQGALQKLRIDLGCWGRLTHDRNRYLDESTPEERLKAAGILAMITAPQGKEKFDEVALTIYELLDNVMQGKPVIVAHPGSRRLKDGVWQDDVQESGEHNGKIQVVFDNGHISSRVISIWSDRPDNIYSDTPDENGRHHQVAFPLLSLDLDALARGKLQIQYPATNNAAA